MDQGHSGSTRTGSISARFFGCACPSTHCKYYYISIHLACQWFITDVADQSANLENQTA